MKYKIKPLEAKVKSFISSATNLSPGIRTSLAFFPLYPVKGASVWQHNLDWFGIIR
jgi:hypothetical protein